MNYDSHVHLAGNYHDVIYLVLKKNLPKKELVSFTCRSMVNYNADSIHNYLDHLNWTSYYSLSDPEDIWYELYTSYINGLDLLAPSVDMKCRQKDSWVPPIVINLIRERDKYKNKAEISPGNLEFEKFQEFKNKCTSTILRDKRDFIKSKLVNSKSNPKKYWANVNELFPSKKGCYKNNKETITLTADYFHNFYTSIDPKLSSKINLDNTPYFYSCKDFEGEHELNNWEPIRENEIFDLVKDLDLSKNSNISVHTP